MADELHARYRALLAERHRPVPRRTADPLTDPLRDLIAALHRLYTSPPDREPEPR